MRRLVLACASLVALGGCSSSSSAPPGSGVPDDPGATSSGGFSLRVTKVGLTPTLPSLAAGTGNVFVVVDVAITNDAVTPSLSESPALFTLSTKSSLVVRASPATLSIATPCRPEVAVASGGSATCELAFEIATTDVATSLAFDDGQGHTASASVPAARTLPPAGSRQPPERPSVPGDDGVTQWFVVDAMFLGLLDQTGHASPNAWKSYGYDLDARITTAEDSVTSRGTCTRRAGAPNTTLVDGDGGIDNSFGAHLMNALNSMRPDAELRGNTAIHDGKGTLLLRLDHVGGSDSAHVPGALFWTTPSSPLVLDGSDVLPVSADSVDGSLDQPLVAFPDGYLAGGLWVSGDLPGAPFTVPLWVGAGRMTLAFDGGVITVQVADGKNGTIAGVLSTAGLTALLTPAAASAGVCPGSASFVQFIASMMESADLVAGAPSFQDTSRACDALSVGLGFSMVKAAPPTIIAAPAPAPSGCK